MNIIITIAVTALVVLYAGLFKAKRTLLPLSLLGLLVALGFVVCSWDANLISYGMMQMDNFALAFSAVTISGTILILLLTKNYFAEKSENIAEYFTLLLFCLSGIIMMVSYLNMAMLFIGIEIMSVSLYILAGIRKRNFASNEASLKYFLMGAFSTGFLLFGITLIYGATGSFDLLTIKSYLVDHVQSVSPLFYPGIILVMIGMCFKIGLSPFHFWVPDVYEGSPSLITLFMATIVKIAGLAAFLRMFENAFSPLADFWTAPLLVIIIVTLFVSNITALYQKSFKRMLSWSSVSHAGYLAFSVLVLTPGSGNSALMYAIAYLTSSVVAFAVLILVKQKTGGDSFESFNGLSKRNPFAAFCLTIAMLSLAGIPLTAGFIGKYAMFMNVMDQYHIALVVIAIINALVGFYYYFRVIVAVYFKEGADVELASPMSYRLVIAFSALVTIFLGIYPNWILSLL